MSRTITRGLAWAVALLLVTGLSGAAWWTRARRAPATPTIAIIPQTAGAMLWDVERFGASVAAEESEAPSLLECTHVRIRCCRPGFSG